MTPAAATNTNIRPAGADQARRYPFLCVDAFLADMVGARALASAFETGLIDLLLQGPRNVDEIGDQTRLDAPGCALLLDLLQVNGVLNIAETAADMALLTPAFREALRYRDLLEARLYFANLVAPDFLNLSTALFAEPGAFFERSRLFQVFSYDRALTRTRENLEATARWMRITTAFTRYEAQACLDAHDFSGYRSLLDIGGNSGEFALQACRRHPHLRATVCDLPLVCEIGRAHVDQYPEGERIAFVECKPGEVRYPSGADLVVFKSMLHDWPDAEMTRFIAQGRDALAPGGTLLIFERTRIPVGPSAVPYSLLPLLLFFRSYRSGDAYRTALTSAGLVDIEVQTIMLETPFLLITARKER